MTDRQGDPGLISLSDVQDDEDEDPWALGTPVVPGHPLWATVAGWEEIERTLTEWGIPSAEARSKAIVARLAHLEPAVLLATSTELREDQVTDGSASPTETSVVAVDPLEEVTEQVTQRLRASRGFQEALHEGLSTRELVTWVLRAAAELDSEGV